MWTVVFGPKMEFPLSNVDTKMKVLDFGVNYHSIEKKNLLTEKVSTVIVDTFLWTVGFFFLQTVLSLQ